MTTTTAGQMGRFDFGRVVSNTVGVLTRNIGPFLGVAAVTIGLPAGLLAWGALSLQASPDLLSGNVSREAVVVFGLIAAVLLYLAAMMVLQGAVIYGTVADLNRRKAGFGEMMGAALRRLLPLIAYGLLSGLILVGAIGGPIVVIGLIAAASGGGAAAGVIAILLGILAFIGVIVGLVFLGLIWAVGPPALVVEAIGPLRAFGRSAALTRGYRGQIFLLGLLWVAIYFALGMVFGIAGLITTMAFGPANPLSIVVQAASYLVQALVTSAGTAAIYFELRQVKEGVGPDTLASVFD